MTTSEPPPPGGTASPAPTSMLSAEASPVSRSVTPASNSALRTSGGAGRGWLTSFAQFDPDTCWWRTSQGLFEMETGSEPSSPTFTPSGSMRSGHLYTRPSSACPIRVDGSRCWPTPRASGAAHMITWSRAEQGIHRSQLEDYLACQYMAAGGQRISGLNVNPEWLDWLMGFPNQVDRLRTLGNAVVPQVAEHIGRLIVADHQWRTEVAA